MLQTITDHLENRLRHRSEMVILEAVRGICLLAADGLPIDLGPTFIGKVCLFLAASVILYALLLLP